MRAVVLALGTLWATFAVRAQSQEDPAPAPKKSVEQLIADLGSEDEAVVERAKLTLMDAGPEAMSPLVGALYHKNLDIQKGASEILNHGFLGIVLHGDHDALMKKDRMARAKGIVDFFADAVPVLKEKPEWGGNCYFKSAGETLARGDGDWPKAIYPKIKHWLDEREGQYTLAEGEFALALGNGKRGAYIVCPNQMASILAGFTGKKTLKECLDQAVSNPDKIQWAQILLLLQKGGNLEWRTEKDENAKADELCNKLAAVKSAEGKDRPQKSWIMFYYWLD